MNSSRVWRASAAIAVLVVAGLTMNLREARADAAPAAASSVSHADMLNWLADGQAGLWIQAGNSRWFYARLASLCPGLESTNWLVFETGASNRIDQTSSISVSGQGRCKVKALVPSNGPPKNRYAGLLPQPQTQ
jgi:hypothetical protein